MCTLNFLEVDSQCFSRFRSSALSYIISRFILLILRFGPSAEILDVKLWSFEDFWGGVQVVGDSSQVKWKLWLLIIVKNENEIWKLSSSLGDLK